MKKMKFLQSLLFGTLGVLALASCSKDDDVPAEVPKVTTGLYVLSEGLFGSNNTTLTYYNFANSTPTTDFYALKNGSGLGDTGQDIIVYGGKMYIVVNKSSYLEVADAISGISIRKIPLKTATNADRQPRYVVGYKNKVFVSSYDGTVAVIDTASFAVEKSITVGSSPEQMVVSGDKLYVSNSGGLLFPIYDSTLSVIDLNTLTQTQKITVGVNPGSITADNAGNVYVACGGNYGSAKPRLVKVSTGTNTVVKSADTAVYKISFYNGALYAISGYGATTGPLRKLSTTDFSAVTTNFITDGTAIAGPYGLNIDETTGDIYVTDAKNYVSAGSVFCFDQNGRRKFSFSVAPGLNPNKVVMIRQ